MDQLLVSFCIATRNRGRILFDCLRRVQAGGLAEGEFEIMVVDNGSTDGTPERAGEMPGVEWIILEKNCGPVAKNLAMARARGEFVVLLDDDAYPLPGAVGRMVEHFRADASLAAAVFDVTLPDGTREASAYPDVFIGAGTGLRRSFLDKAGLLPAEFFMQAEEYDLSFRLLDCGGKVRRFGDMPLVHLKTPTARISQRTTRLDVRNNLYLLAKYVPAPLCFELAADWLARYWWMAQGRDDSLKAVLHTKAYLAGAAEGMARWSARRAGGRHLLKPGTIETIFKFDLLARRMVETRDRLGLRRILLADVGKNMLAYWKAAKRAGLEVVAVLDDRLASSPARGSGLNREYRGIALLEDKAGLAAGTDAIVISNMSPVAAGRRAVALRQATALPVIDLLEAGAEAGA